MIAARIRLDSIPSRGKGDEMPEKQKTQNWRQAQTIIAAGAITGILAFWNMIASIDQHKPKDKTEIFRWVACTPTPGPNTDLRILGSALSSENRSETSCITRTRSS